jgi:GGDEF domain-containing protein
MPDLKTGLLDVLEFKAVLDSQQDGYLVLMDHSNSGAGFIRKALDTKDPYIGDKTLKAWSQRMRHHAPSGTKIGRIAGDMFGLIFRGDPANFIAAMEAEPYKFCWGMVEVAGGDAIRRAHSDFLRRRNPEKYRARR